MGWFLWGITFGWAVCSSYYYSQAKDVLDKAYDAALIIGFALGIIAVIVSISLGISSGVIPAQTPTPTSLGR